MQTSGRGGDGGGRRRASRSEIVQPKLEDVYKVQRRAGVGR